jgi:hypothetical protein
MSMHKANANPQIDRPSQNNSGFGIFFRWRKPSSAGHGHRLSRPGWDIIAKLLQSSLIFCARICMSDAVCAAAGSASTLATVNKHDFNERHSHFSFRLEK